FFVLFALQFFFSCACYNPYLHSFPTRRSSDLWRRAAKQAVFALDVRLEDVPDFAGIQRLVVDRQFIQLAGEGRGSINPDTHASSDRKSTRLNSSHEWISYAVFCLKKKNKNKTN